MVKEYMKKVILLGDGAVGKTSLIRRFVEDEFDDDYIFTIGTKVTKKEVTVSKDGEDVLVTMMIWDILGQTDFHRTQAEAFSGAAGALLVCDLTRKETLDSLGKYWIPEFEKEAGAVPRIFLGNKADLGEKMSEGEFTETAKGLSAGALTLETSAKTGQNVAEAFEALAKQLVDA
jgi:small GTP-binding protein